MSRRVHNVQATITRSRLRYDFFVICAGLLSMQRRSAKEVKKVNCLTVLLRDLAPKELPSDRLSAKTPAQDANHTVTLSSMLPLTEGDGLGALEDTSQFDSYAAKLAAEAAIRIVQGGEAGEEQTTMFGIGRFLRSQRKDQGLSLEQFAHQVGLHPRELILAEHGLMDPPRFFRLLEEGWAESLGCNSSDLITGTSSQGA